MDLSEMIPCGVCTILCIPANPVKGVTKNHIPMCQNCYVSLVDFKGVRKQRAKRKYWGPAKTVEHVANQVSERSNHSREKVNRTQEEWEKFFKEQNAILEEDNDLSSKGMNSRIVKERVESSKLMVDSPEDVDEEITIKVEESDTGVFTVQVKDAIEDDYNNQEMSATNLDELEEMDSSKPSANDVDAEITIKVERDEGVFTLQVKDGIEDDYNNQEMSATNLDEPEEMVSSKPSTNIHHEKVSKSRTKEEWEKFFQEQNSILEQDLKRGNQNAAKEGKDSSLKEKVDTSDVHHEKVPRSRTKEEWENFFQEQNAILEQDLKRGNRKERKDDSLREEVDTSGDTPGSSGANNQFVDPELCRNLKRPGSTLLDENQVLCQLKMRRLSVYYSDKIDGYSCYCSMCHRSFNKCFDIGRHNCVGMRSSATLCDPEGKERVLASVQCIKKERKSNVKETRMSVMDECRRCHKEFLHKFPKTTLPLNKLYVPLCDPCKEALAPKIIINDLDMQQVELNCHWCGQKYIGHYTKRDMRNTDFIPLCAECKKLLNDDLDLTQAHDLRVHRGFIGSLTPQHKAIRKALKRLCRPEMELQQQEWKQTREGKWIKGWKNRESCPYCFGRVDPETPEKHNCLLTSLAALKSDAEILAIIHDATSNTKQSGRVTVADKDAKTHAKVSSTEAQYVNSCSDSWSSRTLGSEANGEQLEMKQTFSDSVAGITQKEVNKTANMQGSVAARDKDGKIIAMIQPTGGGLASQSVGRGNNIENDMLEQLYDRWRAEKNAEGETSHSQGTDVGKETEVVSYSASDMLQELYAKWKQEKEETSQKSDEQDNSKWRGRTQVDENVDSKQVMPEGCADFSKDMIEELFARWSEEKGEERIDPEVKAAMESSTDISLDDLYAKWSKERSENAERNKMGTSNATDPCRSGATKQQSEIIEDAGWIEEADKDGGMNSSASGSNPSNGGKDASVESGTLGPSTSAGMRAELSMEERNGSFYTTTMMKAASQVKESKSIPPLQTPIHTPVVPAQTRVDPNKTPAAHQPPTNIDLAFLDQVAEALEEERKYTCCVCKLDLPSLTELSSHVCYGGAAVLQPPVRVVTAPAQQLGETSAKGAAEPRQSKGGLKLQECQQCKSEFMEELLPPHKLCRRSKLYVPLCVPCRLKYSSWSAKKK